MASKILVIQFGRPRKLFRKKRNQTQSDLFFESKHEIFVGKTAKDCNWLIEK